MRRVLFLSFVLVVLLGGAVFWWAEARPRGARRAMNETLRRSETTESERSELDLPDAGSSPGPPHAETRFRNPTTTLPGPPNDIGELRRLRGKVVWDDGKPVPRADVVLRSSPFDGLTRFALKDHGEVRSLTETNYAGEFELEWVEGSFWALTVFAGLENAAVLRVPPATDEITVVLPRRNTVLEVEVVREATGEAIVGAEVKVTWPGSPYTQVEKTAATGIAQFREALAGSARVVVQGTGGEMVIDHSVRCRTAEVTRTRIEIGLGLTVRLDVVADESGAPVVCAHVVMGFVQDGGFDIGATDSRGKLVAPALPWDANVRRTLSVVADGFATWQCLIGHPKEDGGEQVVHARLVRNATVRLRCVGADGQPRAGVLVIGTTHRMIQAEGTVAVSTQSGRTDAEGRVSLAELAPGFGGLVACWVKGVIAAELPIAAIVPSEMRDLGDIVVRDPRALTGTVFTASGEPAAGASVVIEPHHATDERFAALASALMAPRWGSRVDAAGRFCIRGVQPGSWDLLVHGGGHARLLRVALPIKGAGTLDDLKLRLPPALSLRGRVVDAQGHAAAGVTVEYMRSHPVSANLMESVRTADDGRFEIPGFTREDEGVSVYVGGQEHKVTPRDGPIEIRLSE